MSKKHGHRKRRRRKATRKPAALLAAVARALNDCERAGIKITHPTVAVITDYGVVIPFKRGWAARAYTGHGNPPGCLDD